MIKTTKNPTFFVDIDGTLVKYRKFAELETSVLEPIQDVIDKCRGWSVTYDFVNHFYPNPKVIVMIRDLRAIVASLEKKFRENQHIENGIQNWKISTTSLD